MKPELKEEWQKEWEESDKDEPTDMPGMGDYTKGILRVAEKVMEYLDKGEPVDAEALIQKANKELDEGITGYMAGMVAFCVTKYHTKSEEFKKSWNKSWGDEDRGGVINPALLTINTNEKK